MTRKYQLITVSMLGLLLGLTGAVLADRDDEEEHEYEEHHGFRHWIGESKPVIAGVQSKLYATECGSCHFAYQPGMLPAASWERIMTGLEDHFGENAELADQERESIERYLMKNAADRVRQGLPNRINASLGGSNPPLRITETRFFRHEHDEIPARMVRDNQQVRSFSNCDACHTRAKQGSFREHEIRIPGYGYWDD